MPAEKNAKPTSGARKGPAHSAAPVDAPVGAPVGVTTATGVDPKLLELLVCPVSKAPLVYEKEKAELVSPTAGLAYPIRDGIPVMLPEEARTLNISEKKSYKK